MKGVMNRIFKAVLLSAALVSVVSCMVEESRTSHRTKYALMDYAECSMGSMYLFEPVMAVVLASDADIYLSLSEEDIYRNRRYFENGRFCLVQTEVPPDAVLAACRTARTCGVTTILKPASCLSLAPELLKYVDILVPNQDEITLLCPEGTLEEKADFFLKQGVQTVIITLGADGCYVKTAEWAESFPAEKFQAIDNTGACDAFISALAVYLQRGRSLRQAVRIATFAAGFCITREGVVPSLIDRGSLEAYIAQKAPELLI